LKLPASEPGCWQTVVAGIVVPVQIPGEVVGAHANDCWE
jgi:hypothetical protein